MFSKLTAGACPLSQKSWSEWHWGTNASAARAHFLQHQHCCTTIRQVRQLLLCTLYPQHAIHGSKARGDLGMTHAQLASKNATTLRDQLLFTCALDTECAGYHNLLPKVWEGMRLQSLHLLSTVIVVALVHSITMSAPQTQQHPGASSKDKPVAVIWQEEMEKHLEVLLSGQ